MKFTCPYKSAAMPLPIKRAFQAAALLLFLVIMGLAYTNSSYYDPYIQRDQKKLHERVISNINALTIICQPEHEACFNKQTDYAYTLQFIVPAISDLLDENERRELIREIESHAVAGGHYAHSPAFAVDSDSTAGAIITLRLLGKDTPAQILQEYLCQDQETGLFLYGTFLQPDIKCDGAGFHTGRSYRARHRDFEPTVIASALRLGINMIPDPLLEPYIERVFQHWETASLYYRPVISSYFWLEALPQTFVQQRRELCSYLDRQSTDDLNSLEIAIAGYNLYSHCGASRKHPLIRKILSDKGEMAGNAPPLIWRYDGSSRATGLYIEAYDSGMLTDAMTLRLRMKLKE